MATPARTMTPAPVLHAKPASGVVVKTTPVKMEPQVAMIPPCSSFTPVKSPDQKRPKASAPAPLRRSLCAEMDATADRSDRGVNGVDVQMAGDHDAGNHGASAGKDVLQLNSSLAD